MDRPADVLSWKELKQGRYLFIHLVHETIFHLYTLINVLIAKGRSRKRWRTIDINRHAILREGFGFAPKHLKMLLNGGRDLQELLQDFLPSFSPVLETQPAIVRVLLLPLEATETLLRGIWLRHAS
ncbi:unnamed protein product [Chondrus crispus]|uniref:Uncharacterized protein n=1 Tax=Chondrus crispus TaxID=2769 RepID=R7QC74_CHOCR|nr:unnamed protein product [Chondrus crispus]CDF34996.1 unnamed protein product [Chondrus crispus]|eukprot:XP_005714815.1 unnamed protein product [Chondrus crispus]